jgi:hypothetical protein
MFFRILQIAIPFIWFGAVAAISFMEAPLKFTAPNITLPLGLGIGYVVFHALNKVEIVLGVLFLISIIFAKPDKKLIPIFYGIVAIILILQTIWLFPRLDERTMQVIAGTAEPYSNLHIYYIIFDAAKLILLLVLGVISIKANLKFSK